MNLALITQDFPPEIGGIETYAHELAKRFAKKCDFFFALAPDKPDAVHVDAALPYPVERIVSSNSFLGVKAMLKGPLLFCKHHTSHAFHTQWQTLPISLFARRQGVVNKIYAAAHARELLFNPFNDNIILGPVFERYKRWLLAQVDLFFPVSEYTGSVLHRHGVDDQRIKVVINGTDPVKFYPNDKKHARETVGLPDSKMLLTITRLISRKGVDTVLKSFKKVLKNHPDSYYVIVGEGPQKKQLQRLAQELGIADDVYFTGRIRYDDLLNYYNACDIFLMPSKTEVPNVEGFGIVFLEANACEKPVIGSFSGGIPSAVVNGETGILVEESNPAELAAAIDKLLSNPELAASMGEKGRERVEEEANWDATAQKLLQYMQNKI